MHALVSISTEATQTVYSELSSCQPHLAMATEKIAPTNADNDFGASFSGWLWLAIAV